MTEQEKREKAIEEMARCMCNRKMTCEECIGAHGDVYFRDKSDCKYCFAATRAFNTGYRKADEVRKEIFDKLTETFVEMTAYGSDCNQHVGYYDYSIKVGDVVEIIAEVLGFEYKDYEEHTNRYDLEID